MDLIWRPHKRQEEFLALPNTIFERFYGGAAGGGKSELLVLLPLIKGYYQHPKFKGLLLRRTYPELERSLIARSREWYPPTGAVYNDKLHRWSFPSGAFVDFGHLEHEKTARSYDTTEYNYIGFDELTSFTEFQYRYVMSRCRTSVAELPAFVCSASNPGNVGHGWVRKRFVEPDKNGFSIIFDKRTNQKRIFIPAKLTDNPYLMQNDPGYINRLLILPEAEKRAKLDGDWWTFSGQVFDDWRSIKFHDEPDNAIHVISPFPIPEWWPRVLSIDWGFAAMLWAGWGAIAPNGKCYIYREYACTRKKIAIWSTQIKHLSRDEEIKTVVMCPSAWQHRGDEKNIAEQFTEHSGYHPKIADNDRLGGKMLVNEFIRWEPKPILPARNEGDYDKNFADYILRIKGLEEYQDYLRSFEPEKPEVDIPRLQVFDTCEELINCIPKCVYNDPTKSTGGDIEDVAEFDGDDPYDGLRYLLKEVDHQVRTSRNRDSNMQELNAIMQRLEKHQDVNNFYRSMEAYDARRKNLKPNAIPRFHKKSLPKMPGFGGMGKRP